MIPKSLAGVLFWVLSAQAFAATPRVLCLQHDAALPHTTLAVYKLDDVPDHAFGGHYKIDLTVDDEHSSTHQELLATGALPEMTFDGGKLSVYDAAVDYEPGFLSTNVELASLKIGDKTTSLTCQDDPSVLNWGSYEGWHRILLSTPGVDVKGMEADLIAQGVRLVTSVDASVGSGPGKPVDADHAIYPVTLTVMYAKLIPADGTHAAQYEVWTLKAEGDAVFKIEHVGGTDLLHWTKAPVFKTLSMVH